MNVRARFHPVGSIALDLTLLAGVGAAPVQAQTTKLGEGPLRHATFELRNEVKVKVPEGARLVRVWMALPQDGDPAQQVRDLRIEAPYPHRIERDSEGSRVLYLEARDPTAKEFAILETFVVTRSEIRDSVDPSKTRPLTDADRARFARYLQPNKHVVIVTRSKSWPIRSSVPRPIQSWPPASSTTGCWTTSTTG